MRLLLVEDKVQLSEELNGLDILKKIKEEVLKMNDREYLENEIRTQYKYILEDKVTFDNKKQLYARIYNSVESICHCEVGGIENLALDKREIKDLIKEVIESYYDVR
ncbi:hypothetical protein [Clostridium sp.]|uniref:hypothetical protein n=1 Tax=Clostridium sp. TaxID=1506 RepID=UPI002620825A|nr:hypothetical protein [Clostridium sp.]